MRRRRVDPALTCRDLVELVTDYLEDALAEDERARFEAHVAACEGCDAFVEQVRTAIALAGRTLELGQRPEIHALLRAFREHAA